MKKKAYALPIAAVALAALLTGAYAKSDHGCPMSGKMKMNAGHNCGGACPTEVKGADIKVVNTENGVTVSITAKDPAAVKKIQEMAAAHFAKKDAKSGTKAAKWVCPMNDYEGDKPGKCPKCGMELKEKK